MSFAKEANNDPKIKRLFKVTDTIKSNINTIDLVKEMKTMLLSRKFRTFDKRIASEHSNNLLDWAGEVASHNARLADIRLILTDRYYYLDKLISTARKRLIGNISKGTVTDKKAMADTVLDEAISVLADLDRLLQMSNIVDKELERSYYNAQFVKQVVETASRRDGV